MGTILAVRPFLPSSHRLGRLSQDRRPENSGYRPCSHCPVPCSAWGCGRKEPQARSKGSAGSSGLGAWGQGAAPSHWGPSADGSSPGHLLLRPLSLSVFFTKTGPARPGPMNSWRWAGGWEGQKCCPPPPEGPSGPGEKGFGSFLYSTLPLFPPSMSKSPKRSYFLRYHPDYYLTGHSLWDRGHGEDRRNESKSISSSEVTGATEPGHEHFIVFLFPYCSPRYTFEQCIPAQSLST